MKMDINETDEKLELLINDASFTKRELDIIVCSVYSDSVKGVCSILDISVKTVENYRTKIFNKTNLRNRESLRKYVENSAYRNLVKERYKKLLIRKLFLDKLKDVAASIRQQNVSSLSIVNADDDSRFNNIIYYLEEASIRVTKIKPSHYNEVVDRNRNERILKILSENDLDSSYSDREKEKLLFISFSQEMSEKFRGIIKTYNTVELFGENRIYFGMFKIIGSLVASGSISNLVEDFRKQIDIVRVNPTLALERVISSKEKTEEIKILKRTKKSQLLKNYKVLFALTLIIIFCLFYFSNKVLESNEITNSNIKALNEEIPSIIRSNIDDSLNKALGHRNRIAVLSGAEGTGKTTSARQYINGRNSSLKWEFDFESENSILHSFEDLAYVLSKTTADKEELSTIKNISNVSTKLDRLFLFAKKKLTTLSSWVFFYDNAESLAAVQKYLPSETDDWGNGNIIIGTRDTELNKNYQIHDTNISIIFVDKLTKEEKLELFLSVFTKEQVSKANLSINDIEQILKVVPSYPQNILEKAHDMKKLY